MQTANHPVLVSAHDKLKVFLGLNESSPYEKFLNDLLQYCSNNQELFEHIGNKRVDILAISTLIFDDLSSGPCLQKRVIGYSIPTITYKVGAALLTFSALSRGPSFEERVLRDGIVTETNNAGVALYFLSNYENHSEKIKSYLKCGSSQKNIDGNRISELKLDVLTGRDCYTYMFIGCSLADLLLENTTKKLRNR